MTEQFLHFILQSYLNPGLLIVYLLSIDKVLQPTGLKLLTMSKADGIRINPVHYLLIAPLSYFIWLLADYWFLSSFDSDLKITQLLSVEYSWAIYLGFFITALYLFGLFSAKGISANPLILFYIHFPVYMIGLLSYFYAHLQWVHQFILS